MNKIKSSVFLFLLLFPILVLAQSKQDPNSSLEIIPDRDEATKVEGVERIQISTGMPVAMYRPNYPVRPDTPENMARQFLLEKAASLMHKGDLSDLQYLGTKEMKTGYRVRFEQQAQGYPVYGTEIKVSINHDNKVVFATNEYKRIGKILNEPAISEAQALQASMNYLSITGAMNHQDVKTIIYNIDFTKSVLAYQVNLIPSENNFGDWELIIAAKDGEILRVEDRACYYSPDTDSLSGSGWVFDPDPLTNAGAVYGDPGFVDNNDADSDQLTEQLLQVELENITFEDAESLYYLKGPYAEIVDSEAPFNGLYKQSDSIFHYTRSADNFEAVNCYHHIHHSMKYLNETLGFDIMPHQYEGGVQFDPHGLNGADNAHYMPGSGQIAFGEGGVDDAEDVGVVLHELGHGIHDWATLGGLSQADGLSEGLGDYWVSSYIRSLDLWEPEDDQYNWVFIWDGHNQYWSGRVTNDPGHYPEALIGQVHKDGQLWASSLMQLWDLLGAEVVDSDCWEGISMTGGGSNQVDAAYAFVQADIDLYDGEHLEEIYTVFYDRGYLTESIIPLFAVDQPNGEPRDVVFTDNSISFLNPIVSWEWDFNDDGEIDSYDQNPSYTFTEVGAYTISMTVSDGETTKTIVKKNFITVNGGFFVFETRENLYDHSGVFIREFLEARGYDVVYSNYYPTTFEGFEAVFLSFGNIGESLNQGTFTQYAHTIPIQNYLENGGSLYSEGSPFLSLPDFFEYPNADQFKDLYGVASTNLELSANSINELTGLDGTINEGMAFNGSTQLHNWYIDNITPNENALVSLNETGFGDVSIYNEGDYDQKVFHFAYSLADLDDEDPQSSRTNFMIQLMDFFGYPEDEGYVVANFDSDETEGESGLEVQFTDWSISDDGYDITDWAWDFNEDGEIDSYDQNPVWTYNYGGNYDIMLVVSNGQSSDTLVRQDLIIIRAGIFVYESEENGVDQSGTFIRDYFLENDKKVVYANHFPSSLVGFDAVFASFGSGYYSNVLDDATTVKIKIYLIQGGNFYLEGSSVFGSDQAGDNQLRTLFGLESVDNGSLNSLTLLSGQENTIMSGIEFNSSNQINNNSIDIYEPDPDEITSKIVMEESDYGPVAVQFDGMDPYGLKTVCMSYSMAQLTDGENPNTRDEFLQRIFDFFDPDVSIGENSSALFDQVKVFPNPASDYIVLEMDPDLTSKIKLEIMDIWGHSVVVKTLQSKTSYTVDIGHLPPGTYFYRTSNEQIMQTGKFVISR